jgi:signal transduction histidine kinase
VTTAATPLLLRRLTRGQLLAFDAVLAVVTALLGRVAAAASPVPSQVGWHEPAWVSVGAGLLLAVPVAARRYRPLTAAVFALVIVLACVVSGVIPEYAGAVPAAVLSLVLYTVGVEVGRRRSVQLVAGSVVSVIVAFVLVAGPTVELGVAAWVIGASWAIGRTIRERRVFAARAAEQATELAVGEERLRIAREIHDIVAHAMSMIAVKATIADHLADTRPQEMREALRVIAATSRDALGEMRRALGVLRTEGTLAPTPGLSSLDELVGAARSAGVAADLTIRGKDNLPEDVALTVFRLVQEALTNVMKHSRATACRVDVEIGQDMLHLEVTDNGPPGTQDVAGGRDAGVAKQAGGQGLIGMRERAARLGGELTAGPAPGGGWAVATTLRWVP